MPTGTTRRSLRSDKTTSSAQNPAATPESHKKSIDDEHSVLRRTRSSGPLLPQQDEPRRTIGAKRKLDFPHYDVERNSGSKCPTPPSPCSSPQKRRICSETVAAKSPSISPSSSLSSPLASPKKQVVSPSKTISPTRSATSDSPDAPVSREKEMDSVKDFILSHVKERRGGSLYISGKPGTGKTMVCRHIMETFKGEKTIETAFVNSAIVKSKGDIFKLLAERLLGVSNKSQAQCIDLLSSHFVRCDKMVVVLLDEVDLLVSSVNDVLYQLFEWPLVPGSRLVLVSIANAHDLIDRVVPLLEKRGCRPSLMSFLPYTMQQLEAILSRSLSASDGGSLLPSSTIKLCAARIVKLSGDIRQAVDVCQKTIALLRLDKSRNPLLTMNSIFDSLQGGSVLDNIKSLSLVPKLILCALVRLSLEKVASYTFEQLQTHYRRICAEFYCSPVNEQNFSCSLDLLVDERYVHVVAKGIRNAAHCVRLKDSQFQLSLPLDSLKEAISQCGGATSLFRNIIESAAEEDD